MHRLQEVFREKEQCLLDLEEAESECVENTKRGRLEEVVWWLMVLGGKNGGGSQKEGVCGTGYWNDIEKEVGGREGGSEGVWGRDGHVGWLSEDV